MSDENAPRQLVAPPGWQEAMQGKTGNANRVKASKRAVLVLSLMFFGFFIWCYIIYSLGHPKKASAGAETPIAVATEGEPMGAMPQAAMPLDAQGQAAMPIAASPFGMPRGIEGAVPAQTQINSQYGMAPAMPAAGSPYATAAYTPNQMAPSPAMGGPTPMVPSGRGGVTMSAPREFRHAIGVVGGSMPGMPNNPTQRLRTYVSR